MNNIKQIGTHFSVAASIHLLPNRLIECVQIKNLYNNLNTKTFIKNPHKNTPRDTLINTKSHFLFTCIQEENM